MMTIPFLKIISPGQKPRGAMPMRPTEGALVGVAERILKSRGFNNTDVILSPTTLTSAFFVLCIDPTREVIADPVEFNDLLVNGIAMDRGVRIELVQNEKVVESGLVDVVVGAGSQE